MTTEVWRSMQYKGSEIMREVAWIIFDEVHYMRDRERGVVWEESIVMAPKNSRFVFLSATVPNAKEFAQWVAKVISIFQFWFAHNYKNCNSDRSLLSTRVPSASGFLTMLENFNSGNFMHFRRKIEKFLLATDWKEWSAWIMFNNIFLILNWRHLIGFLSCI